MPAQKRSLEAREDESLLHQRRQKRRYEAEEEEEDEEEEEIKEESGGGEGDQVQGEEKKDKQDDVVKEDSDRCSSSSEDEKPEFLFVELGDIRKVVQCPICLVIILMTIITAAVKRQKPNNNKKKKKAGKRQKSNNEKEKKKKRREGREGIIRKTRTVMECLHRFCRECIDKSMRLGNNECPACRTHCASRRSLRDDPNFDALIAALYPDIDKYEEEELILCEEEKTRNKQIQASIAQIFQRQSEALTKKRKESPYAMRSQRNYRNSRPRRRRDSRGTEFQASDDNEDENDHDGGRDSSSADERSVEVRQRRCRRRRGPRSSQPSSSVANLDGGCMENDFEEGRESRGRSPGLVWSVEMLAWGRGGVRSNTRHGSGIGGSSRNARTARLSKLVDFLRGLGENPDEFNVRVILISWDKNYTPSLQQPYLCCPPSLSIRQLCEYIALQTPLRAEEVEILVVKEMPDGQLTISANHVDGEESFPQLVDSHKHELQVLQEQETLAGLNASYCTGRGQLVLAYKPKQKS